MKEPVDIEYTATARSTLEDIIYHLKSNDIPPAPILEEILNEFETKVRTFPMGCQLCPELLKIGSDKYRECNTSGGYRILYSYQEPLITVHAFLSQKQSLFQTLFKRLIEV